MCKESEVQENEITGWSVRRGKLNKRKWKWMNSMFDRKCEWKNIIITGMKVIRICDKQR